MWSTGGGGGDFGGGMGGWGRWSRVKKEINVEEVWKAEEEMSLEDRRKRYLCGSKFITLDQIEKWDTHSRRIFKEKRKMERRALKRQQEAHARALAQAPPKPQEAEAPKAETTTTTDVNGEDRSVDAVPAPTAVPEEKPVEKDAASTFEEAHEKLKRTWSFAPNEELNKKISTKQCDITRLEIDAVVNAANSSLLGGGGIDGAIHRAAGDELYDECVTLDGCATGFTKITRGYALPAKFVLHTVGPIGEDQKALESCYKTCLELVEKHNIRSVAFCGVSTGIFGYPLYPASHVAIRTIREWLETGDNKSKVDNIMFCTFLDKEKVCYEELLSTYFPPVLTPEDLDDNDDEELAPIPPPPAAKPAPAAPAPQADAPAEEAQQQTSTSS